ncbi:MAG: redoxin domain-containing protein [Candidatus Altiarchaeales archaeon]|nr:redoxin domain-containing protein [Candidatus Altiarchaeales archaeon]
MLRVGDKIPEMEFEVYEGDKIKKTSFKKQEGKWLILLFYPADFTFVCPTELEQAEQLYDKFQAAGAQLMSISTDTAFVHKAWHDHSEAISKITYPMAADPTGRVCREFGTYIEDEGVSLRATFIIDPEGYVKSIEIHDNSIGRNSNETLRKLQAAKFVEEHDGKVCPANWMPGADTLTPGVDLVGKI